MAIGSKQTTFQDCHSDNGCYFYSPRCSENTSNLCCLLPRRLCLPVPISAAALLKKSAVDVD